MGIVANHDSLVNAKYTTKCADCTKWVDIICRFIYFVKKDDWVGIEVRLNERIII